MKKSQFIAGALALSLVLAGTGYAYWTDALHVTTKATTGDMDVKFVDMGLYAKYSNELGENYWSIVDGIPTDGYQQANAYYASKGENATNNMATWQKNYTKRSELYNSIIFGDSKLVVNSKLNRLAGDYQAGQESGDTISLSLQNMYPGYAQVFRTDIANDGSIAAKLADIEFNVNAITNTDRAKVNDMIGIAMYNATEGDNDIFCLAKQFKNIENATFEIGGVTFVRLSALNQVEDFASLIDSSNSTLLLGKLNNGTTDLFIGLAMDPDASGKYTTGSATNYNENNKDYWTQGNQAYLTINFMWDQYNVGTDKQVNTGNILKKQN